MNNRIPWIALTATEELPIFREPMDVAAKGLAEVKEIPMPYKPLTDSEIGYWSNQLAGAAAILLRSGYITEALLHNLKDLKIVAVHGSGVDPVDVDACTGRGIYVTNTPGANADAVAEITLGLMLSLARNIPSAVEKVKSDLAWDDARYLGTELKNKTLGLLGLGQIGGRVSKIAIAFGMNIIAHDPAMPSTEIQKRGVKPVSLSDLAKYSDFLSLHAPATDATNKIINRRFISLMKQSSLIINCARGSLIDEHALADALISKKISGAALDVLDGEPPDPKSPLFHAPNVLVTPHMAGSTAECLKTIANTATQDIIRVLKGQQPQNAVNTPIVKSPKSLKV